jgi:[methyl-Co(III) methanol-specific corrinoid protein]:coenzyme M methyltransferase
LLALSSKDRVMLALKGKKDEIDRTPVTCANQTVTVEQMDNLGIYWPEGHSDAEKMAQLGMAAYKQCGLEVVDAPFDQAVEAEILGCEVDLGKKKESIPSVPFHGYKEPGDVPIPEDFLEKGRIPTVLKAIEIMKKDVGEEAPVISHTNGPFSLAGHLGEINKILIMILRTPEKVKEFAEIGIDLIADYANAQFDAGADVVTVEDMLASTDILSPQMYDDFAAPFNTACIKKIKGPTILHVCGKGDLIVESMISSGATNISVDMATDLNKAIPKTKGRCTIMGSVDTIKALFQGTPEIVREQVISNIRQGVDLVAPGCALSPLTKSELIKAMVDASIEYFAK